MRDNNEVPFFNFYFFSIIFVIFFSLYDYILSKLF